MRITTDILSALECTIMSTIASSSLLRFALRLDGVASLGCGALTTFAATPLALWLGTSANAVFAVGLFMLAYGLTVFWLGQRPHLPRWVVLTVIGGNLLWVLESLVLPLLGWISPSPLGWTLLSAQAAGVAVFAELQYSGLRRSGAAHATERMA